MVENSADVENLVESLLKSLKFRWKSGKKCDSPFLDSFFLFLECLFLFLLLCILAMFAIHAITQIASKTEKLWAAQKTSSQFCVLVWYAMRGVGRRRCEWHSVNRSGDTAPQSFRLVKQTENPAPLTQGSREPRSDGSARAFTLPRSAAARYLSLSRNA